MAMRYEIPILHDDNIITISVLRAAEITFIVCIPVAFWM